MPHRHSARHGCPIDTPDQQVLVLFEAGQIAEHQRLSVYSGFNTSGFFRWLARVPFGAFSEVCFLNGLDCRAQFLRSVTAMAFELFAFAAHMASNALPGTGGCLHRVCHLFPMRISHRGLRTGRLVQHRRLCGGHLVGSVSAPGPLNVSCAGVTRAICVLQRHQWADRFARFSQGRRRFSSGLCVESRSRAVCA